jgi:iodotyrosine deiodinase
MSPARLRPLEGYAELPLEEMIRRAAEFRAELVRRRTVRDYADRHVPRALIEDCLRTAGSAPSGANLQPWHFVAVADRALKREIRLAAEAEEREFYQRRAPEAWLEALAPLGTGPDKPFLEYAPWLIAIFEQRWGYDERGHKRKHYYPKESVGIATGLLIAALHHAGLATLTHTPSPMKFLSRILDRPPEERPFLMLVTGYPAPGAQVPDIHRKRLEDIVTFRDEQAGAETSTTEPGA